MGQFGVNPLLLMCVLSVSLSSQADLTVEAEPGDGVTLWCPHKLTRSEYIFWYKQGNSSVPVLLGCKQFMPSSQPEKCYFFTENDRMVMNVSTKNTSLRISTVNQSDSGLYYCSFMQSDHLIFSSTTELQIRVSPETLPKSSDEAEDCACCEVLFKVILVFGAVTVVLLSVLVFVIVKSRKRSTGVTTQAQENEEQDRDSVNYAALQFSNKKNKKTGRHADMNADPHIVYSSIRQQLGRQ
ncbi:uncharacterized protein LOC108414328 [Pygocentrus nattereri]|uniref:Ig-like domain-containing protein n=1 Tax=Pygocentrus nattereri TaxID=42514 RepID=A0A3B4BJR9_PYGNA|nr:uncharacterized protein LOC108414328 [Pygocentrus nattereri]